MNRLQKNNRHTFRLFGPMLALLALAGVLQTSANSLPASVEHEITFVPGRVYEVTGLWVKEGKLPQLQAYFGEVFPIAAQDYGVKPLFSLEPKSAYSGDFLPHMMFVSEWPSLESFKGFLADRRAKRLFPRRDDALSRIVVTQYTVPEQTVVSLKDGDLVEFAAMWVKKGREQQLMSYYQQAFPIAVANGASPITPLQPAFSYRGEFLPDRAALNLWASSESFDRFASHAGPLFPQRDEALDRLEVTHARVRFESEGH